VTTSPGGGGPELRRQLAILKRFLDDFDLVRMKPQPDLLRKLQAGPAAGKPEAKPAARVLAEAGKQYAVYVRGGGATGLSLDLPEGAYRAEWLNPRTGKVDAALDFKHPGGERALAVPPYAEDVALRIKRARP
jgi:hypothetical protein